jgi:hypothetical protein
MQPAEFCWHGPVLGMLLQCLLGLHGVGCKPLRTR